MYECMYVCVMFIFDCFTCRYNFCHEAISRYISMFINVLICSSLIIKKVKAYVEDSSCVLKW